MFYTVLIKQFIVNLSFGILLLNTDTFCMRKNDVSDEVSHVIASGKAIDSTKS